MLPMCRYGVRLVRYLKYPGPGSAGTSKLVASLAEPGLTVGLPGEANQTDGIRMKRDMFDQLQKKGKKKAPVGNISEAKFI